MSSVLLNISNDVIAEPPDDGNANDTVTSSGDGFGLAMSNVGADVGAGGGVAVVCDAVPDSVYVPCELTAFNE